MAPKKKAGGKKVRLQMRILQEGMVASEAAGMAHVTVCVVMQQYNTSLRCRNTAQEKKKDAPAAGDVEGASIEELSQKIMTLEKEKNKEEEYRNYMQLERVRAAPLFSAG
jgi:hypothetical protein